MAACKRTIHNFDVNESCSVGETTKYDNKIPDKYANVNAAKNVNEFVFIVPIPFTYNLEYTDTQG